MKAIKKCRICGEDELVSVINLGVQKLTGVFPKSKNEFITSGPLELVKCVSTKGCGLVQLRHSYDLGEMYGDNYGYRSGLNTSMVRHLESKVKSILNSEVLLAGDLVVDIGSNDGTTLRSYPKGKFKLVGIDPTGKKFAKYYTNEIQLISDFFSKNTLYSKVKGQKAKVITSFSMFYDIENPIAFACEIADSLHDDGIWIFEQSYLPSMIKTNSFDTICHEHLEFYSLKQILWIADNSGLKILDVEFNDINGGSFSITAAKKEAKYTPQIEKIRTILLNEEALGLNGTDVYDKFKSRVDIAKIELLKFLKTAKSEGKRVCGLGASTKGNVLLQHYGIDTELLTEIGEVNPDKFGTYTPGTGIPLVPEEELLSSNPDYLLVLPWHFRDFFLSLPTMKGRTLVFPLPNFEIIEL
jgi:hypothetical protein